MSLTELPFAFRLSLLTACHFPLALWSWKVVAPARIGAPRLKAALALLPLLVFMTRLFDAHKEEETVVAMYCVLNYLWLTPFKLHAFCMNRGQLTKSCSCGHVAAFTLGLAFPVTVAFRERPIADEKSSGKAYKDVEFAVAKYDAGEWKAAILNVFLHITAKVCVMIVAVKGYVYFGAAEKRFWVHYCVAWYLYGLTAVVEDVVGIVILFVLNIKLENNFDCPWLSRSVSEFWSKRYNLAFGESFRSAIYHPIRERRQIRGEKYFSEEKPTLVRKVTALLVSFAASGLMHMAAIMYAWASCFPIKHGLFFVVNGIIVCLETVVSSMVRQGDSFSFPPWVGMLYVHVVVSVSAHLLLWVDYDAVGYTEGLLKASKLLR